MLKLTPVVRSGFSLAYAESKSYFTVSWGQWVSRQFLKVYMKGAVTTTLGGSLFHMSTTLLLNEYLHTAVKHIRFGER